MNNGMVLQYIRELGYDTAPDDTYTHIDEWLDWYQGEVAKFHYYSIYNGQIMVRKKRYSLGMAKKVCEDWANLILNEKVSIKAGDQEKRVNEILEKNNFQVKGNALIEIAYALGTGAFVEYRDAAGEVVIDYIRADMIYPLSWKCNRITECAFGSSQTVNGKEYIYLQLHRLGKPEEGENPKEYYIENVYLDADSGKEVDLPEDIFPLVATGYDRPLFQIVTPNIFNNIDLDSPMGVSVYANAIPQVQGADLIYDSYVNEFVLGRKRVLVPISMAKMQMAADGVSAPVFDPNETVFYQMPADRNSEMQLTSIDMSIRAQEHELGIQRCLDLLSLKCGMGTGRYQFDSSGVKTATEVISDKSDLYQNRQKNALVVKAALIALVKAIVFLDNGGEVEPGIDFDDSIIEDTGTTIDKNIKLVQAGLRSKLTAIMEINKCSETDAKKELERIAEDGQITGQDVDWTGGDDAEEDDSDTKDGTDENQDKQDPEEEEQTDEGKSGKKKSPAKKE